MSGDAGDQPTLPSYWVHFARAFPFLMLCGVVGPIFLAMALFADGPVVGWMLWLGLVITAGNVALAAGLARGAHRKELKRYRLAMTGRTASADVLSMEETGSPSNGEPVVHLRLRIHGSGITPFEVEERATVPITAVPLLHGGSLAVRVDPETREYEIDWRASSQQVAELPAATSTPLRLAAHLAELDDLLKKDLISPEEYATSRRRILGGL